MTNPALMRWLLVMAIGMVICMLMAANFGAMPLSMRTLFHAPLSDMAWQIWLNIRLPRVLLAVLLGVALAVAGAGLQGLCRKPLADPGWLGISRRAGTALAGSIRIPPRFPPLRARG